MIMMPTILHDLHLFTSQKEKRRDLKEVGAPTFVSPRVASLEREELICRHGNGIIDTLSPEGERR